MIGTRRPARSLAEGSLRYVLELRHLRYFVAVAEELNFSRAARRLFISAPALSVAIRKLERTLGVDLLDRSSRQLELTEAGEAFLAGACRTLSEAEQAVAEARRAAAGQLGKLRIGYSPCARFEILPAIAAEYSDRSPDVELLTEEMWNAQLADALKAGAIDVALAPVPEVCGELSSELVRTDRVIALMPETHPQARTTGVLLSDLDGSDLVSFPRELAPRLHDALTRLCERAGFEAKRQSLSLHTNLSLGTWPGKSFIGLAPSSLSSAPPPEVVAVPLDDSEASLEYHVSWRTDNQSAVVAAFVEVARATFVDRQPRLAAAASSR